MKNPLRGILVGFGTMGQLHADRFMHLGVRIQAVAEPDPERRKLAQNLGMTVVESPESIPASTPVDFFDICSPSFLHARHIKLAMAWKKAIFVEKPVVTTLADAAWLRQTQYAPPIFVGEVEQYNPSLKNFLVDEQPYPRIAVTRSVNLGFFLKGNTAWFLDEQQSGGIVFDLMIHDLTLLVAKYGMPAVRRVTCSSTRYPCIDTATATLDYGTREVEVTATWTSTNNAHPVRLHIDCTQSDGTIQRFSGGTYGMGTAEPTAKTDPYRVELRAFLNAVRQERAMYPLNAYLDAIALAANIRSRMQQG